MTGNRILLALDAGVRERGWAVFEDGRTATRESSALELNAEPKLK